MVDQQVPFISAHRPPPSVCANSSDMTNWLHHAAANSDYVELDVCRTADDVHVVSHSLLHKGRLIKHTSARHLPDLLTLHTALDILGTTGAHIDIKCDRPIAVAQDTIGAHTGPVMFTVVDTRAVDELHTWRAGQDYTIGLSLPAAARNPGIISAVQAATSQLFYAARLPDTRADFYAVHHWPARLWVGQAASKRNKPLLVWTVNSTRLLETFCNHPNIAGIVTNNLPGAHKARNQAHQPAPAPALMTA